MLDLDEFTCEQYRARYEALQSRGRARAAAPKPMAEFADVPPADPIATGTLPTGQRRLPGRQLTKRYVQAASANLHPRRG
jgi:hypothetical protein